MSNEPGGPAPVPDPYAVPDQAALEGLGESWRPHRSTAARLLWHGYLVRRGRVETSGDLFP
jgi:DNA-3-methyladenine glycosylase II